MADKGDLQTRQCGMMHPDGVVCGRNIFYQPGCCTDKVFNHKGPHERVDKDGNITHRWIETREIEDLPFNAYLPLEDEDG